MSFLIWPALGSSSLPDSIIKPDFNKRTDCGVVLVGFFRVEELYGCTFAEAAVTSYIILLIVNVLL